MNASHHITVFSYIKIKVDNRCFYVYIDYKEHFSAFLIKTPIKKNMQKAITFALIYVMKSLI